MLRPAGDILSGNGDGAAIDEETARNGVEQRRFSGAVRSDHGDEGAFVDLQRYASKGQHFVQRSREERLLQLTKLQHAVSLSALPSAAPARRRRRSPSRA